MGRAAVLILPLLLASLPGPASAHSPQHATLHIQVTSAGALTVDLKTKAEAFFHALGSERLTYAAYRDGAGLSAAAHKAWTADLKKALLLAVEFSVDGQWTDPTVEVSPPAGDEWFRARYVTSLGAGHKALCVLNGSTFGKLLIQFSLGGDEAGGEVFLDKEEQSAPFSLIEAAPVPSRLAVARQYLVLGYEHILPQGLDHILFVLSLFLLSTRLKPLLVQVTAFTLAHSITLALSMYQVVSLPPSVVEPLIALSIVFVAVENVLTDKLHAWRPVVVFMFGLLHGLGFASVLRELGLPRERFVTALVTFNLGVELGQLTVVLGALALVWRIRERAWYRKRIVVPGSVLIALVGFYWCVERTLL